MWLRFDLGINVERDFVFLWAYFAVGVEAMKVPTVFARLISI